jgi:hypothetical protein
VTAVAILRHLPDDSATSRYRVGWPIATHVAVRALEELGALTRITLSAHGVKKSKLPEPLSIERPTPLMVLDTRALVASITGEAPQEAQEARREPVGPRWARALMLAYAQGVEVVR